ncbi:putative O-linked N-acetylglucosamine transferase, SPINDLY family [Bacteroidales bacterium Barb4]|nr:putative O-linked N-acetylglucosamine transferase, SPINDLY family [Bacteroidales bacterium Barb4]
MKKILPLLLFCCIAYSVAAQSKAPKWLEKQRKAVITVTTYGKDNKVLHTGIGFFITATGETLSSYTLFNGAERAEVTDAVGNVFQVVSIMGVDELYDVVKFKTNVPKSVAFLPPAVEPLSVGTTVYAIPYSAEKKSPFQEGAVSEINKLKEPYGYYKTTIPLPSNEWINAPVLTETGEVLGLIQADASGKKDITYALSAGYANSLAVTSTVMLNTAYTQIGIRKAWPADADQANVTLYLLNSTQDAKAYLETLNDFIATFPANSDGYQSRALHYAYRRAKLSETTPLTAAVCLARSLEDFNTAAKHNPSKGNALFEKARAIYTVAASDTTLTDKNWTLPAALAVLQEALASDNQPLYHQLEGDIRLAAGEYEKAYESYMTVNRSEAASPASFYWAAKALENVPGANIADMTALMDSAFLKAGSAPTEEKLAYLLERIEYKTRLELYPEAVADYNLYYDMQNGNVGDAFFYYRGQARFRSDDPHGALEDMQEAVKRNPEEPNYLAEEASVYIRLENYPDALVAVDKALSIAPNFASCHRLKGICFVRQGDKATACESFNKAKELGDPLAARLIREHCQ